MLTLHYKSLLDLFLCLLHASVRQQQFFMTRLFKLSTNFLPFVFSIHIQLSKTLSEIYFLIKKNKRWRLLFLLYLPNQCNVSLHRDYISARKIKRKCNKKNIKVTRVSSDSPENFHFINTFLHGGRFVTHDTRLLAPVSFWHHFNIHFHSKNILVEDEEVNNFVKYFWQSGKWFMSV